MQDGTSIDGNGSNDKQVAIQDIVNDLIARQSHDASCDLERLTAAHPELMPELGHELREFQIMRAAWQCAGEETLSLVKPVSLANGRYQLQALLGEGGQKRGQQRAKHAAEYTSAQAALPYTPNDMYFTSRYSSIPQIPPSRPTPDIFMPPKGAWAVEGIPSFTPTMP